MRISKFCAVLCAVVCSISTCFGGEAMPKGASVTQKKPLVILLGAPGSGKGTQAEKIVQKYNIVHISTGDMFRANIKNKTPIGLLAQEYTSTGRLVPDGIVIDMFKNRLAQSDCTQGALLDGFPRTLDQAKALEALIGDTYIPIVISLEVSDKTVVDRLTGRRSCPVCNAIYHVTFTPPKKEGICDKCGAALITRNDDTEKTVKDRLQVFHEQIGPLKSYYVQKGILTEVNGEAGSEATTAGCFAAIDAALQKDAAAAKK